MKSPVGYWNRMPVELRRKLLPGFFGKLHLLDIAGWCLRSGQEELEEIAVDALSTAFAQNPLDGAMAHELLGIEQVASILDRQTVEALSSLAKHWKKPDNTAYYDRLRLRRDFPKILNFIEKGISEEPGNLFWREQALFMGMVDGNVEWVRFMLEGNLPVGVEPIFENLRVLLGHVSGQCHEAALLSQSLGNTFGASYPGLAAGMCLMKAGDRQGGLSHLLQVLERAPWNTGLMLLVHDLIAGVDSRVEMPQGDVVILLYSWNKDIELDSTLGSLYASDLGSARLVVLDNGSTDRTAEVLESWQLRFGPDRMEIVSLPVNVGAPAARNWLMHLPGVSESDYVVYLDDDVALPQDWLGRLGAAAVLYPDAGVWGCRVVDHANPLFIQHADAHLTVPEGATFDLSRTSPNPFRLTDLHVQGMDSGLFSYMRPCASVTGCCHMFKTGVLLESGDFAIQLSPSQYDDYEHDLRLAESGLFPVYTGHLAVLHKKRSGVASRTSPQAEGNALGNKYKMQTMHSQEDIAQAAEREAELVEQDILRKMKRVEEFVAGSDANGPD